MCPPLVCIFGDPKLSGSDRNQETRFRGCNRSTSRLNYGFVSRSHNYVSNQ